ncbi:MAG: succinylglutamate desuccinylase/aspartoacylase family protein [Halobacteriaceae archaeon]
MFGEDVDIDTTVIGSGQPELSIVGGIHGDEPSGIRAIRRVLDTEPGLERPVQFIVANPPAAVAHRRSLDVDMNRVFPGDTSADMREKRLAANLREAVKGSTVLSLHSTHSSAKPFAFVSKENFEAQALASQLPVDHVINHDPVVDGAFTSCEKVVSIETGRQLTKDATINATKLVRAFLRLTDTLPDDPKQGDPDYYTLYDVVEKPSDQDDFELFANNFQPIEEGTIYAKTPENEYIADEEFTPILMSETGYDEIFGYKGRKVGETLSEARETWGITVTA